MFNVNRIVRRSACAIAVPALLVAATPVGAEITHFQDAVEAETMSVSIREDGTGRVTARECQRCPKQVFKITPTTIFRKDGQQIAPADTALHNGEAGTVIYLLKNDEATQVNW
ncbi:MAG: hypothetical protein SVU69_13730 [Pseudomonadota bacterium]|nr:hypothetical protein [Pseudomonadota bacterium]